MDSEKVISGDSMTKNYKRTTSKSIRDYEEVKYRSKLLGTKLSLVSDTLKIMFGEDVTAIKLLKWAKMFERMMGLQIERLARRNRQALFCWFAENWETIQPYLYMKKDDRKYYDIRMLINYH